jgi:thiamine phosphate synthase YjbQ (UPF0047 family)
VTSVEVQVPFSIAAALPSLSVFDITNDVSREVSRCGTAHGIAYITAACETSLVRVTEREAGFFCDFEALLSRVVAFDQSRRERMLTMMLGPRTEGIPFSDGQLCMGHWQRLLLFGFSGDSRAEWHTTVVG